MQERERKNRAIDWALKTCSAKTKSECESGSEEDDEGFVGPGTMWRRMEKMRRTGLRMRVKRSEVLLQLSLSYSHEQNILSLQPFSHSIHNPKV